MLICCDGCHLFETRNKLINYFQSKFKNFLFQVTSSLDNSPGLFIRTRALRCTTRSSDSLVLSIPYVRSSLGKRAFSVIGPRLWNLSWYPKLVFCTNIPFQAQNTPFQNCVPSLGSFPSPFTVYPDFDSCYSHFMPYRMTPSVRHKAIDQGHHINFLLEAKMFFNFLMPPDYGKIGKKQPFICSNLTLFIVLFFLSLFLLFFIFFLFFFFSFFFSFLFFLGGATAPAPSNDASAIEVHY